MPERVSREIGRYLNRAARIAYAFVVMNSSAAAALPALLFFRKHVWR